MTLLFPILLLLCGALSFPAFRFSRRKGPESRWVLFLSGPALALWLGLTMSGYGAQSLSNIIEVLWLAAAGVVLCYLKVFGIDRFLRKPLAATYGIMVLLAAAALLLRTFMPTLPE